MAGRSAMTVTTSSSRHDAIVVGGGFYGARLARALAADGSRVLVLERGERLLGRASFHNQARVHNGYHYPRSFLTGLRSRVNYARFVADYAECVVDDVEAIYAVSAVHGKVTGAQFQLFAERIGAPIAKASRDVAQLFDERMIEAVFAVEEAVFDADVLAERVGADLKEVGVDVRFGAEAQRVSRLDSGALGVVWTAAEGGAETRLAEAPRVFNCTYARLNKLLVDSGLAPTPLIHELTEMALVEPPAAFRDRGVTVMCGPFFSMLPFPSRGLHTLSHVRFTPHGEWRDDTSTTYGDPYRRLDLAKKVTAFPHMVRDAARYLPCMAECRYRDSLWEVKTVLPRSEVDDSRPILLRESPDMEGLSSAMGSKIDNVADLVALVCPSPTSESARG